MDTTLILLSRGTAIASVDPAPRGTPEWIFPKLEPKRYGSTFHLRLDSYSALRKSLCTTAHEAALRTESSGRIEFYNLVTPTMHAGVEDPERIYLIYRTFASEGWVRHDRSGTFDDFQEAAREQRSHMENSEVLTTAIVYRSHLDTQILRPAGVFANMLLSPRTAFIEAA